MRDDCIAIRRSLIQMSRQVDAPHLASALSVVEILVALYKRCVSIDRIARGDPERDRVYLSKGHAAMALYATLAHVGLLDAEALHEFGRSFSSLPIHPQKGTVRGIEASSGSLGYGLALGVGAAFAALRTVAHFSVYVIQGDGECQEGSVWEAAQIAGHWKLHNMCVLVDSNGLQSKGFVSQIGGDPSTCLHKWEAFGWHTVEVDGHDVEAITRACLLKSERPRAVIARTIKGKGIRWLENNPAAHTRGLLGEHEVAAALEGLQGTRSV